MIKVKNTNNPNKLQSENRELSKIQVVDKKLHDIKNELSRDYAREFEMIEKRSVGDQTRETHKRIRNFGDFEHYVNAIDEGDDAEDAIFNGYNCKIKTLQFDLVNRGEYGNGCDFKHEIIDYWGNICFIPTKVYCFHKCVKLSTIEDYKQQYLDFLRNEKRRSIILTQVRIQPFCWANNIKLGYFYGVRVFRKTVIERNKAS